MSNLNAFLAQNAMKVKNEKVVVSERFANEKGKVIKWEIKSLNSKEDEAIRKECTRRVKVPGKKGLFTPELDTDMYLAKLAVACTVYPDLHDKALQDSYGVFTAEELIKVMLLSGEYTDFISNVQKINGYDISLEELSEEAKN